MSLINDALKRATEAQQTPHNVTPGPESKMTPADRHSSVGFPVYFMPVLLFIFSGACFFLIYGWKSRPSAATQAVPVHAREPRAPDVSGLAAAEEQQRQPVPQNRQFSLQETPAPPASAAESSQSTAAPEDPENTAFRLQGIFYRARKPSAVVNSKTVYIGDTIGGGKVTAIDRDSVTLLVEGEKKVLTFH
jgi:hypothetical protein